MTDAQKVFMDWMWIVIVGCVIGKYLITDLIVAIRKAFAVKVDEKKVSEEIS